MRALVVGILLSAAGATAQTPPPLLHGAPLPVEQQNLAYHWLEIAQEATAREVDRNGARPTIISRTLAIWATGMYDAWAAYDEKAVGTRLGASLRRPPKERTLANKQKAVSYASYRTLLDVYPDDKAYLDAQLKQLGYDPADTSTTGGTPQAVGNLAAAAVIAYRHGDGANQLGDEAGGTPTPYSDYTFYRPANSAERCVDPDRWQPIEFDKKGGGKVTPGFLTPHWYRVRPFGLQSAAQFRPGPPPKVASEELRQQTQQCLDFNAHLDAKQKATVEFMRDGPRSTGQSGHWLRFAADVSRRDHHDLDADVKLFFSVANVAFDAFIACWEAKRFYDSSRPWTLVRHYFAGKKLQGWGGPGKGVVTLPAEQWRPYSPSTFITPPFPGFPSGHSTVSGASARVLELVTGSDRFGAVEKRPCCALTEPAPGEEVTLELPTFSATAELAGISRVMGGYHIQADNLEGLKLGRQVADHDWAYLKSCFDGTAKPRP